MTSILLLIACHWALSSALLTCVIFEVLLGLLVLMPSIKFCSASYKRCASGLRGRS
jgi:hypothetical protein